MSDFFAGVNGARFPDVVMNQGPLPGMGGLPTPLHDTPDGRINYNSSLLGDIEPYAYGEPGYLSSQNSYLNIPHKIQKIVPFLFLPNPDGTDSFRLNHPIDDGDIAFTLRLDRNSEVCGGLNNRSVQRFGLGTAIDPMINLCTLNYLLAGIQLCTPVPNLREKWDRLLHYLDSSRFAGDGLRAYDYADIKRVVRHLIRPFGIAHGSEKQGGQHEGSLSAVTWPVSFVISLTLDGKDANMVNIWHKYDVEAGNDLVLRLKPVPIPPGGKYTLNHWAKGLEEKTFTPNTLRALEAAAGRRVTHIWQLVPDIFSLDYEPASRDDAASMHGAMEGLVPAFRPNQPDAFCWQEEGYWHIARAQVHSRKYGLEEYYYNDMANNLRTGHMDATFQPTFYSAPYRAIELQDGPALDTEQPAGQARNAFNLLGAEWQSSLRLERDFGKRPREDEEERPAARARLAPMVPVTRAASAQAGMVPVQRQAGVPGMIPVQRQAEVAGMVPVQRQAGMIPVQRLAEMPPPTGMIQVNRQAEHVQESGLTEDIGVLEEAGPLPPRPSLLFSVAKPGLPKPARRPQKSRGILGSVLSADGSVSHEQSRML